MKRSVVIGLSTVALVMGGAIVSNIPANAFPDLGRLLTGKPSQSVAQKSAQQESPLQLQLSAAKQVTANGKVTWQESGDKVMATPGDVLRYRLKGINHGEKALSNLVLTQPVPKGMVYQLNSASTGNAQVAYSIDGGKSYSAKPMVSVKLPNGQTEMRPAPAEAYTNLRWQLSQSLATGNAVDVAYEVNVR
jgi:uncharacterized repeat protein (TIGR01451 family)